MRTIYNFISAEYLYTTRDRWTFRVTERRMMLSVTDSALTGHISPQHQNNPASWVRVFLVPPEKPRGDDSAYSPWTRQ
jgi:hypothetical protein